MKMKLCGLIGIILSILVLIYFETTIYKLISIIGININNYSNIAKLSINIIIKLLMCFMIFLIYKKDFKSRKRSNDNLLKVLLQFIVILISVVIGMYLFNYVINFLGDIFNINVLKHEFYNIFNKKLDIYLIIKIISDYIIIPFLYCSVIILSIDKLFKRNNTCILLTGVLASIVNAISLSGTLGFVIINSLYTFLLFSILMFIYKKHYNIYFIISLYSFYLISSNFIISYLGW